MALQDITTALLGWYDKNKRDLPWRKTAGEYAVVVSEMMLQQTRVDTVVPYYNAFMARFPDVFCLARADEADVLHAWQGLGYYRRARNLHKMARTVARNGGVFPSDYKGWLALPGVGPYIAGAVMSIAQGAAQPAVDGNVLRVIARLDANRDDISLGATRKKTEARVLALMPPGSTGDFTQALMELGALVCTQSPRCDMCPLAAQCRAYQSGVVDAIPVKTPKAKPVTVYLWAGVLRCNECVLLVKRQGDGLLAGMWGVPVVEKQRGQSARAQIAGALGRQMPEGKEIGKVTHVFTHRRWEMDVVCFNFEEPLDMGDDAAWVRFDEMNEKAIPAAFKKVLRKVKERGVKDE